MTLRERFARALLALRTEVLGINGRNVRVVYPHNPRRHFPIADDKVLAKQHLEPAGVPVPRTLFVARSFADLSALGEMLRTCEEFVMKPANGSGGGGIVVVVGRDGDGWRTAGGSRLDLGALRRHAADVLFGSFTLDLPDVVLVEERLVPHPVLATLFPDGLSDVRVITLAGVPAAAMVRVPTRASGGRANLHQGAIGLGVDLASGTTTRARLHGRPVERHPDTKAPLAGIVLPQWPRILEVARLAAAAVPLGYLGVDVGLDAARGPVVLEINKRPGLEIQNVNGHGLRPILERIEREASAARAGGTR